MKVYYLIFESGSRRLGSVHCPASGEFCPRVIVIIFCYSQYVLCIPIIHAAGIIHFVTAFEGIILEPGKILKSFSVCFILQFSHHVPQKMKYPPPFPLGPNSSLLFSPHALGKLHGFSEDPMLQDSPFANWAVSYDSSSQFPNYLTSKASPPLGPDSSHSSSSDGDEPNGVSSE